MIFETIVSQYDKHNEVILLLFKKFKPKKLVFTISNKDEGLEVLDNYKAIFPKTKIIFEVIKEGNINDIENVISKYDSMLINLVGGERINALMLFKLALERNIQSIYVDLLGKIRYVFKDNVRVIDKELDDLYLDDIIEISGAKIVHDSSEICNKPIIINLCKIILKKIDLWHQYKQRLYDNNTFIHNYKDCYKVTINKNKLNLEELDLVNKSIDYLHKLNGLEFREDDEEIKVTFKNDYLKGFIFKSGTWLEVLTHMITNEIKEVDEVKSGLIFSWGKDAREIKNELDVVAIRDSVLICISCKDSDKYDEDALNELNVYSERLGGKDTIKILVATKEPNKTTVRKRAQEMGIKLIILEKDINKFKKTLRNSILN